MQERTCSHLPSDHPLPSYSPMSLPSICKNICISCQDVLKIQENFHLKKWAPKIPVCSVIELSQLILIYPNLTLQPETMLKRIQAEQVEVNIKSLFTFQVNISFFSLLL